MSETIYDIAKQIIRTEARGFSRRVAGKYDWITAANYSIDGDHIDLWYYLDLEALVEYFENSQNSEVRNGNWGFEDWIDNCFGSEEAAFQEFSINSKLTYPEGDE